VDIGDWKIPENLQLADSEFHKAQRVDLLIGASLFYELLCVGQIKLLPGLPLLQKTLLGWVVSGDCARSCGSALIASRVPSSASKENSIDVELDSLLQRFWEVENCPGPIVQATKEELDCEAHIVKNYTRLPAGDYSVRLPLKLHLDSLGDSYPQALRRFFVTPTFLNISKFFKRIFFICLVYIGFQMRFPTPILTPTTPSKLSLPHYSTFSFILLLFVSKFHPTVQTILKFSFALSLADLRVSDSRESRINRYL